ncbi:DoxX family protein [Bowmanella sp. Y26]|uniref:DoxX family protein n=1 Tax=Bowmanella yangjiangensis TaxID=2811230 RepID=UPI001BDD98BA|nr:DoxX family protein [Bowmanella yangjiangensis]MBT1063352.1 DoxX family protein [Bowmanella yangjiangensis]
MNSYLSRFLIGYGSISKHLNVLQSVFLAFSRLYVGWVFFSSGLTKLDDWESTLFLFEYEYQVPVLNFVIAAYLATVGEIILPVLLFVGLATRFSAIGLSIVNVVAVISLEEIAPAALNGHIIWGLLLLQVVVWGAGKLSIDRLLMARIAKNSCQVNVLACETH